MNFKPRRVLLPVVAFCLLAVIFLSACGKEQPVGVPAAEPEKTAEAPSYENLLRISELMIKNRAFLADSEGCFSDWIELENISGEPLSLSGWTLSDSARAGKPFSAAVLEPGGFIAVFTRPLGFSLSEGETATLFSPDGKTADCVCCPASEPDVSYIRDSSGLNACKYPTPGNPNTGEGRELFPGGLSSAGPIIINEVSVSNISYAEPLPDGEYCDWVEVKNISSSSVSLRDYYLSDDYDEPLKWRFPDVFLQPGECAVFYCADDYPDDRCTGFKLSADYESLYLCTGNALADYASLRDIPLDGSLGRKDGENGWFYFNVPSPGADNSGGFRYVSALPEAETPDGVYNDVDFVDVVLSSPGEIHYTLDGTVPTAASGIYTGPVRLESTTILRAIALEEGCAESRVLTLSYIINEYSSLPVLSIVPDDMELYSRMYRNIDKSIEVPGSIALYDGEEGFCIPCGITLKGHFGLYGAKKSLGVSFRGKYGASSLDYDVFGNGMTHYDSLAVRAGQDWQYAVLRNELFQNLGMRMSDAVISQHGKYCTLFVNGEYRGIYCLKEELNRSFYSEYAGVSKESVETVRGQEPSETDYEEAVYLFVTTYDMTRPENYRHFCEIFDVEGLIDWMIIEGVSANDDTQGNVRFFRSSEGDGKWHVALFDLDWAMWYPYSSFRNVFGGDPANTNAGLMMPHMLWSLLRNNDFRSSFLKRYSEVWDTALSNEAILAEIDALAAELEPEIERNCEAWGLYSRDWYRSVDELRNMINSFDWQDYCRRQLFSVIGVTAAEQAEFFAD